MAWASRLDAWPIITGSRRWHRLALCAVVAGVLYLPGLGRPALWEPDEGRYAEIAREMLLTGDYVTPRDDWVRYFEKPPLMYWATATSIRVLGENEFAVRLPVAIFSIAEAVVTCAIAETMFGASVGLLAALAIALSPLVFGYARFLTLDPALAFFVTAALGAFYAAAIRFDFGTGAGRSWLLVSAAMVALGTMTKGPVALVICGGVALAYLAVERRLHELTKIPWIGCALVYFSIAAPWFIIVARRNPEFLQYFFVHEHLHRYVSNTEHGWGPWFLVAIAAAGTWPWLYFIAPAISAVRRTSETHLTSAARFLTIWFLFVLVFFSIPRSKLGAYVLPGIPALAILSGYGIAQLREMNGATMRKFFAGFAIINVVAATICVVALLLAARRLGHAIAIDGILAAACLAIAGVASFLIIARGRSVVESVTAIAFAIVVAAGFAIKARSDATSMNTYRGLANAIVPYLQPGCVMGSYLHQVQSLPLYTHSRETMVGYLGELSAERNNPDAAPSFMYKDELPHSWVTSACMVLIVDRKDYAKVVPFLRPAPVPIACEGKKIALYNRSVSEAAIARDCWPQAAEAGSAGLGLPRRHL